MVPILLVLMECKIYISMVTGMGVDSLLGQVIRVRKLGPTMMEKISIKLITIGMENFLQHPKQVTTLGFKHLQVVSSVSREQLALARQFRPLP